MATGAIPVAKVLDPIADAYGVAILEEGIELRQAGITKPIRDPLVLRRHRYIQV